ncbi:hypothetical protein [Streptomyces sp. NPDC008240]|uniref:hypothetical protein n=1 Tax=Streptomyces sp. NPDC008240 TaxID=3364822 RepID=UPI0036E4E184
MSTRARIHAMFPLDESAESELDARLDAYRAEVLNEAAAFVGNDDTCDCGGCDTCVPRQLADGLRQMARARGTRDAGTPDFFQPGHTYTENAPFRAPEDRANFQCIALAIHPTTGDRRAFGFEQPGAGHPWRSSSLRNEEWADGWVEVAEGGEGQ